jgi:hypothetical protein
MANAIYPKWKEALLGNNANAGLTGSGTTGLYVALVDTGLYTYNSAHQFYTSLAGIAGTDQEITAVTIVGGTVDGNNTSHPAVPSGPNLEALVIYRRNAGASTTWQLVAYLDTGVAGLPIVPNGSNIDIAWNIAGIFTL